DQDRLKLARGGGGQRNLHFHRLDQSNLLAVADIFADVHRHRANPPRDLPVNLYLWHSAFRRRIKAAFCCCRTIPEVPYTSSGIYFRKAKLIGERDGKTLGTAEQGWNARR